MQRISSQTSLQAIKIYRQALTDNTIQLEVNRSGNIYITNKFERTINNITDFFRKNPTQQRYEQAKEAIRLKFQSEIEIVGKKLSTVQQQAMNGGLEMLMAGEEITLVIEKLQKPTMKMALQHIHDLSKLDSLPALGFAWQATKDFMASGLHNPDAKFSYDVATLAIKWKKELSLGKHDAYRLAFNTIKLNKRYGISNVDAKEILKLSGRLCRHHKLEHKSALQFAIDLYVPLQKLGVEVNSVEHAMKKLQSELPELKNYGPKTRISVAVFYLQLVEKRGIDNSEGFEINALQQVGNRLSQLKEMQKIMPKNCIIDQIHQGCHVRGSAEMESAGFKALSVKAATLTKYPTFKRKEIEVDTLPLEYENFEQQFVSDLERAGKNHYELKEESISDDSFMVWETKRRNLSEFTEEEQKEIRENWAKKYQDHFGSTNCAETISRFQSQTFIADIMMTCKEHLQNENKNYTCAVGGRNPSMEIHTANKKKSKGISQVELQMIFKKNNATLLNPSVKARDMFLLPNTDWSPSPLEIPSYTLKFEATIPTEALENKKTNITVTKVSETWDCIPDWDKWMEGLPEREN